jgi:hypothetical protein
VQTLGILFADSQGVIFGYAAAGAVNSAFAWEAASIEGSRRIQQAAPG